MSVYLRPCQQKACLKKKSCKHKHWHYRFRLRGRQHRGAIPEARTQWQAEQAELRIKNEFFEGRFGSDLPGSYDFCKFVDKIYLEYARRNKESWKHDEFRCAPLKEFFKGKRFCDITPMLVVGFINTRLKTDTVRMDVLDDGTKRARRRSPVTVHKEVMLLSAIFNMAIDEEKAIKNPCRKLPKSILAKIPARNKRDRLLTWDEEESLFSLGLTDERVHLRPVVTLALNTGIRRGGLLTLKRENINLGIVSRTCLFKYKGQELKVELKPNHLLIRNKGGKPYTIPLNQVARKTLEALLAEAKSEYLFFNEQTGHAIRDIKRGFTTACRKSGIENLTFHDLRHAFATRLKEAGVDAITRRDLLGHTTVEMTADYTHSFSETKQSAVDALVSRHTNAEHKTSTKEIRLPALAAVNA
jgi:integrase